MLKKLQESCVFEIWVVSLLSISSICTDGRIKKQLFEKLKDCLKDDKAKHNVLPPSRFGVVEVTRQRVREVTDISTEENCPCCDGSGKIQASVLITDTIEHNLRYLAEEMKVKKVVIKAHPFLSAFLNEGV